MNHAGEFVSGRAGLSLDTRETDKNGIEHFRVSFVVSQEPKFSDLEN